MNEFFQNKPTPLGQLRPRPAKTITEYPTANDPRVVYMREVKNRHFLRISDLVKEFDRQGYPFPDASVSQYLQGRIKGGEGRLHEAYEQFQILDKRLKKEYKDFAGKDMSTILEGWYRQCGISGGDRYRSLSKIINVDASTVARWATGQVKPKLPNIKDCNETIRKFLEGEK